jgi:hypothetical protein
MGFEGLKQVVLHAGLLAPSPLGDRCNKYVFVAMGTIVGWGKGHPMENNPIGFLFCGVR